MSWRIRNLPPYPKRLLKTMVKNNVELHTGTRWFIRIDYNTRLAMVMDRYTGKKWYLLV